jgi:hypothetical protein
MNGGTKKPMFDRTHIDDDRTHAREKANKEGAHMKKPSYKQNLPMQYVSRVEAVSLINCSKPLIAALGFVSVLWILLFLKV